MQYLSDDDYDDDDDDDNGYDYEADGQSACRPDFFQ